MADIMPWQHTEGCMPCRVLNGLNEETNNNAINTSLCHDLWAEDVAGAKARDDQRQG